MINTINKLSGKEYMKRIQKNPTVIIPTGACEVYGPHLPMGSDLLCAKAIAELVAEKTGALVAPTIEMGESSSLGSYPCTFVCPRNVLESYLQALMDILVKQGLKNFIFITGHAGNVDTVTYLSKKYVKEYGINACQIDWWRFTQGHSSVLDHSGPMAHGHAAECGTSVMLYLYPELVNMEEACKTKLPSMEYRDIIQYGFVTGGFGDTGMLGDATCATAEKGKAIVDECVDSIVSYINANMSN